jgi:hypothetical protein
LVIDNSGTEPSITILSPGSGDVWQVGSSQRIRWSTVSLSDVSLSYSTDGVTWVLIETSIDENSDAWLSYTWLVPDTLGASCRILIKGYNGEAPTMSEPFEIRARAEQPSGAHHGDLTIVGSCASANSSSNAAAWLLLVVVLGVGWRNRCPGCGNSDCRRKPVVSATCCSSARSTLSG